MSGTCGIATLIGTQSIVICEHTKRHGLPQRPQVTRLSGVTPLVLVCLPSLTYLDCLSRNLRFTSQ